MPKVKGGKRPRQQLQEGRANGECRSGTTPALSPRLCRRGPGRASAGTRRAGRGLNGGAWCDGGGSGWRGLRADGAVCLSAGILFNTGAGQHILKNPLVVNSIIEKVRVPGRCPCAHGAAGQSGVCVEPKQFCRPEVFSSQRLGRPFPLRRG